VNLSIHPAPIIQTICHHMVLLLPMTPPVIKSLDAGDNQITDMSAVAGLSRLEDLSLDNNQIIDCDSVTGLTNLTDLWVYNNRISDITAVSELTNLRDFLAYNNCISDIRPLSGLTNLEYVVLLGNQISDISALSGFTNLIDLDLRYNPLNDDAYEIYIPMILVNNPLVDLKPRGQKPSGRIFFVDDDANSGGMDLPGKKH
jgi:hypothetical protein